VDQADQLAEKIGSDAGDDADADREQGHHDETERCDADFPPG
jgi:hypothetical protein